MDRCAASRTSIRGATSVAPASTVEIVLTPSDDQVVAQFMYEVVNLRAIG